MTQRIVILRPVDVMYTVVSALDNIAQIIKGLKVAFPELVSEEKIGLCSQILTDQEGVYYTSQKVVLDIKTKLDIRIDEYERRVADELIEIEYNSIAR